MNLTVRPYEARDRDGYAIVRSRVYRGGAPVDPNEVLVKDQQHCWVVEDGRQILGSCLVLEMTATSQGVHLPCAGIAGVGVLPQARQLGVGQKLMAELMPKLKDQGYLATSLYAFREDFYRKFGYEVCSNRAKITLARESLPKWKLTLPARELSGEVGPQLAPCLEAMGQSYSCMNRRNEERWWVSLGGSNQFTIYAVGDPIEAYALVRLDGEFWEDQPVREIAWRTLAGYESIMSILRGICHNKTSLTWWEPVDGPYMARWFNMQATIAAEGHSMFRILDVPGALASLKPDGKGEVSISIADALLPENFGPWRVAWSDGIVEVTQTSSAQAAFTLGAFNQSYFGRLDVKAQIALGGLTVDSQAAAQALSALFPRQSSYCLDLF